MRLRRRSAAERALQARAAAREEVGLGFGWLVGWLFGSLDGCMHGWMDGWLIHSFIEMEAMDLLSLVPSQIPLKNPSRFGLWNRSELLSADLTQQGLVVVTVVV